MAKKNLVAGTKMTSEQRKQIKAAFVHRFTGNHKPAWVTKTPNRPDGVPYEPTHATDDAWINDHAFNILQNGDLGSGGAEPVYMAKASLSSISGLLTIAGHSHVFVQANTNNPKLMAAYKRLRELCTGTTAGAAVKKLWQSAVSAHAWYLDSVSNDDLTSAKFEESCGDYTFNILGFVEDLKEYETKAKSAGVGEEIIAAAHAFITETKTAFATFRKSLKNEATAGVEHTMVKASDYRDNEVTFFYKKLRSLVSPTADAQVQKLWKAAIKANNWYVDASVIDMHEFKANIEEYKADIAAFKEEVLEYYAKVRASSVGKEIASAANDYEGATRMGLSIFCQKIKREATAAAEFTIKPSMKLEGDYGSIRMYEGSQLRTQSSLSEFTSTKLVNIYKKAIAKTIKPDPHLFQGIDMIQRHSCHTTLTVSRNAPRPKPGVQVLISDLGNGDIKKRYELVLVNASGKPVYSKEDITPAMTLKITEMTSEA